MSLTAARPAGGDKPRPYILRVSGDRKYVVGAAFMAARGRPQGSPLHPLRRLKVRYPSRISVAATASLPSGHAGWEP